MKENKRGRVAIALSVLLHIIVLTVLGRLLPSGESAPVAMLEFELISTVQAAEHPSLAPEISAPPASAAPPSAHEPVAKQLPLPVKKPAETVSPASAENINANNNGVSFAQTAQMLGEGDSNSAGSGDNFAATAPPKIVKPPQLLHKVEPTYPENARRQNLEGKVIVRLEVSKNGSVAQATIEQSSGQPVLDNAALAAVKKWRFVPARDAADAPMRSFTNVPVVFELN